MSPKQQSRGVPLPSFRHWLLVAAALSGGWFVWWELRQRSGDADDERPSSNPVANLKAVEATAGRGREAVPLFVAELASPDSRSRGYAVYGLGRIGHDAAEALGPVRERLDDDNAGVRTNAVTALRRISTAPDGIAADIARMLRDPDVTVRDEAAKAMAEISPDGTRPLLDTLGSDRAETRSLAVHVLRNSIWKRRAEQRDEIGEAVRRLLKDSDPAVQAVALTALVEWKMASQAEIGDLLHEEDPRRIEVALTEVMALGEAASGLLPEVVALIDRLQLDTVPSPGNHLLPRQMGLVLRTLESMKTAARAAAPRLIRLLQARRDYTRTSIAKTLAAIGIETDELVPLLVPLLVDEDHAVAWHAGELLVQVSPEAARQQVSLLIPQLGSGERVDKTVLYALHALGPQAREAVPVLIPLLPHTDSWISDFAAHTLKDIGLDAASSVPALAAQINNGSLGFDKRTLSVEALGAIGPAARSALPRLIQLIEQPDRAPPETEIVEHRKEMYFRGAAILAIGNIGDDDPQLLQALRPMLSSRWPQIRVAALKALARLDGDSPEVLADLVRRLRDDAADVRAHAALEIGALTCDRRKAVTPLIKTLADENPYVRTAAAKSLGQLGAVARSALPALRDVLADADNANVNWQPPSGPDPPDSVVRIRELDFVSVKSAATAAISAIDPEAIDAHDETGDSTTPIDASIPKP